MPGTLSEDSVVIADQKEASQIYNRGNYGYPMSGGGLELDLIEAAFLVETSRLEVTGPGGPKTLEDIFRQASEATPDFDTRYLVYRDLRQRGFVVKIGAGSFDLLVYPRGEQVSGSKPKYGVIVVSERAVAVIDSLFPPKTKSDKETIYAVADEEGDITYYRSWERDPKGDSTINPKGNPKGILMGDKIFVMDAGVAEEFVSSGFYGKDIGGMLQLSIMESEHLSSKGLLKVVSSDGKPTTQTGLEKAGSEMQKGYSLRMLVYSDLRGRGLIPKTGFKYGTHFRAYEKSPDACHARYLVHCMEEGTEVAWPELSRTVRLSGGVKKEILMAIVGSGVRYLELRWFRP